MLRENICRCGAKGRVHRYGEIRSAEVRPPRKKKMVLRKVRNVLYCDGVRLTQGDRMWLEKGVVRINAYANADAQAVPPGRADMPLGRPV